MQENSESSPLQLWSELQLLFCTTSSDRTKHTKGAAQELFLAQTNKCRGNGVLESYFCVCVSEKHNVIQDEERKDGVRLNFLVSCFVSFHNERESTGEDT